MIDKLRQIKSDLIFKTGLWLINHSYVRKNYRLKKNVVFGESSRNTLDYYQSLKTTKNKSPLILFYYGGNWRWGKKEYYAFVADGLCEQGFDVVVPDYRLYPHVRFDTIIDDAANACRWVLENLGDRPIIVMGHSAGAQLGSLLVLNQELLASHASAAANIKAFVGLSGPYDFYPYSEDFHYDLFGPEENYPASQPVNFVRPCAPPLYLLHGREDVRVKRGHSKSLMEKSKAVGGNASREVYDDLGHADMVLSFSALFRNRRPVLEDIARFIQTVI